MNLRQRLAQRVWSRRGEDHDEKERGATLVLASLVMLVLMGMAGFAVDLGWLYLKTTEAQKAAEAAALAGVVHMPNPSSIPWGGGAPAYATAVDVAGRNGYTTGGPTIVAPNPVPGKPNQLNVDITTAVPTFFMRVFGVQTVSFSRDATAEQLPPLRLGSDEPSLGSDPARGINRGFWVAINGETELKENGDPFSTRCTTTAGCGGTPNGEYRTPVQYFYAVEVPQGMDGQAMTIQVYDGSYWDGNRNDFRNGDPEATGDRGSGTPDVALNFTVYEPDATPNDPGDNSTVVPGCDVTFSDQPNEGSPGVQTWTTICSDTTIAGIYVIAVTVDDDDRGIIDWSFRTTFNGSFDAPANPIALYGIGAMSLDMIEAGVAPTFKLAKIEEFYAGNRLVIGLFDPGDISSVDSSGNPLPCAPNCFAQMRMLGDLAAYECQMRVNGGAWGGDDSPGAAPCEIDTINKRFNGDWVELAFDLPSTYTCASDCWMLADYDLAPGTAVNERTTWTARIDGQPIHLLP